MKSIKKYMVIALCAVIVACSVVSPMTVFASASDINARVVDVALTKTGVVANSEIGKTVEASARTAMREALIEYDTWLKENNITEINLSTFQEFIVQCEAGTAGASIHTLKIMGLLYEPAVSNWIANYRLNKEQEVDIVELTTGKKVTANENITLTNDVVDYIREIFDIYIDAEADYVWIPTLKPSDINVKWFTDKKYYDALKQLVTQSEHPLYVRFYQNKASLWFSNDSLNEYVTDGFSIWVLNKPFGIVRNFDTLETTNYKINANIYDEAWQKLKAPSRVNFGLDDILNWINEDITTWSESEVNGAMCNFERFVNGNAYAWIMTSDGRKVKVFKNLDAYKNHTIGKEPYYVNDVSDSYNTTDNSVTVSGDYITGSNYQYSHDVVQNEIDNSQNVDNSVVNNIVNNNTSTIINNYASSVIPDSGNGGNDSGSGGGLGSILDGLGSIISAVSEIVGFLLGVIGDVIGLIGQLFTVVFNGLKTIGTLVGDFPKLLGDLFVFIPQELIDFLVLAIEASIGIAIWRKFSKK